MPFRSTTRKRTPVAFGGSEEGTCHVSSDIHHAAPLSKPGGFFTEEWVEPTSLSVTMPGMPGRPRPVDLRHLVRLGGSRNAGWQLRMPPWHPQSAQTQYFADSKHGSSRAAYLAARAERDRQFSAFDLPLRLGGHTRHRGNKTGIVGVYLSFNPKRKGEGAFSWVALWSEGNKPRKRSFSVTAHGFSGALMRAVDVRERHTGLQCTYAQICEALDLELQMRDIILHRLG